MVMKRGQLVFILFLLFSIFAFPNSASAKADQYGYNAEARAFRGTLTNWEAFLQNQPPTSFDWKQKDTTFIVRKWDKKFAPFLNGELPLAGAWEYSYDWEYLSGDQLGWTRHRFLKMVYSPNEPMAGAIASPPESIGITGFYLVRQVEWLTGPHGEKQVSVNFSAKKKD